jgi:hypothetical protein
MGIVLLCNAGQRAIWRGVIENYAGDGPHDLCAQKSTNIDIDFSLGLDGTGQVEVQNAARRTRGTRAEKTNLHKALHPAGADPCKAHSCLGFAGQGTVSRPGRAEPSSARPGL